MKFRLKEIPMELFLGVPDEERAHKQQVLVSVFFEWDGLSAAQTDDLSKSIDYSKIYELIVSFSERHGPIKLLEKVSNLLKKDILDRFPEIENFRLEIEKFPFPAGSIIITD